jgi:hypothetical protein
MPEAYELTLILIDERFLWLQPQKTFILERHAAVAVHRQPHQHRNG